MSKLNIYKEHPFCNKCFNVISHVCVPREICDICKIEIIPNEEHICKKKYNCLICQKGFPLLKDLKTHIKTHKEDIYKNMNNLNIVNTKNAKKYIDEIGKGKYKELEEFILYKLLHTDSWSREIIVKNLSNNSGHQKYILDIIKKENPSLLENVVNPKKEEEIIIEEVKKKTPLKISKKIVGMVASLNPKIEEYENWTISQGQISYSNVFKKLLKYLSEKEKSEEYLELDDDVFDIIATKLINPILMKSNDIIMDVDLKFSKFSNIWSKYACKTGRTMLSYIDSEDLDTFYIQRNLLLEYVNK